MGRKKFELFLGVIATFLICLSLISFIDIGGQNYSAGYCDDNDWDPECGEF